MGDAAIDYGAAMGVVWMWCDRCCCGGGGDRGWFGGWFGGWCGGGAVVVVWWCGGLVGGAVVVVRWCGVFW